MKWLYVTIDLICHQIEFSALKFTVLGEVSRAK